MQLFAFLSLIGGASALIASPMAAHATQQRVAASPMMACNGGKGGSGGEGPPLDKMRRGRVKALIQAVRGLPSRASPCPAAGPRHRYRLDLFTACWHPSPFPHPPDLSAQADDADKVKAILLSSQTERLLLNTNWKVRSNLNMHLRKRATQFGVEVPLEFGAFNVRPRNTCAYCPSACSGPSPPQLTQHFLPHPLPSHP
jgi:hypothetical protein